MKNIFLLLLVLCSTLTFSGNAPDVIQKEFDQRFPGVTEVIWERENPKGWIAEFVFKNQNVVANYSFSGQWVETKTEIQLTELPEPVKETVNSFYPDWKIVLVSKIENPKNEKLFRVAIQMESKLQEILLKEEGTLLLVGIE